MTFLPTAGTNRNATSFLDLRWPDIATTSCAAAAAGGAPGHGSRESALECHVGSEKKKGRYDSKERDYRPKTGDVMKCVWGPDIKLSISPG